MALLHIHHYHIAVPYFVYQILLDQYKLIPKINFTAFRIVTKKS